MTSLHCRLLGGFRVVVGRRLVADDAWLPREARQVLALLVLTPSHSLSRERVQALVWPDHEPHAAAHKMRRAVRAARRALAANATEGARYLRLRAGNLTLCPGAPPWVDCVAFEAMAAAARAAHDPARYRAALDLYTGDLLPEEAHALWTVPRRAALRELYLALLLELARLHELRGETDAAVGTLQQLVGAAPAHEAAHVALMRLFAGQGQRHRALHQYELLRDALRREAGAEPTVATRRLHQALLADALPADRGPASSPLSLRPPRSSASAPARPHRRAGGRHDAAKHAGGEPRTATPRPPGDTPPGNLPVPPTRLIGRADDVRAVCALLERSGLVTVAGSGGVGKTHLARAVAAPRRDQYPDGVWFVDLGGVAAPAPLAPVVADALGLRDRPPGQALASIVGALGGRRALLVLDGCEHVLMACAALVEQLRRACPALVLLATSQQPLGVPGEAVWRLGTLTTPRAGESLGEVESRAAVELFVARARLARPSFVLDAANAEAVGRLCRAVDGLPLMLELAAASLGKLSLEELVARLDAPLDLLNDDSRARPRRHRSARALFDWSHDLLTPAEQAVWRRLAGFADSWSLDGARAVVSGADVPAERVEPVLAALVDKSLVNLVDDATPRYALPALVREYARARLRASGEADAVAARHAIWCLQFVREGLPALRGPDLPVWLEHFDREQANLSAALAWARDAHREDLTLELAAGLWAYWHVRGQFSEGRQQLAEVLGSTGNAVPRARARVLRGLAHLARDQGDLAEARHLYQAAMTLSRAIGDDAGLIYGLLGLAQLVSLRGEREHAHRLCAEGLRLAHESENERAIGMALLVQARIARDQRDYEAAAALGQATLARALRLGDPRRVAQAQLALSQIERARRHYAVAARYAAASLAGFRALGDARNIAVALHVEGRVAWDRRQYERAMASSRESLACFARLGARRGVAACLTSLAMGAVRDGRWQHAARLLAAADALCESLGAAPLAPNWEQADHRQLVAAVRGALGEDKFRAVWTVGRACPADEVVAWALAADTALAFSA